MTQVPDYGKAPVSKRRQFVKRWLIRLGVVATVLCIVIPTSFFVWAWWENRQLDAEVASLRAAGEPAVLSDLNSAAIPVAVNAVPEFRAAAAVIEKQSAAFKKVDDLNGWRVSVGLPLRADERAAIRAALDASAEAFALVESASAKPGVGLDLKFTSPAMTMLYPDLNEQRALTNALSLAAFDAQNRGDTAAALRHVEHILRIGQVVDHIPILLGHLVSLGIDAVAAVTAQQVAADAAKRGAPLSPEARREVESLIKQFLDETESDGGLRRALAGERASGIDAAQAIATGSMNKAASAALAMNRGPRAYMLRNGRGIKWYFDDALRALAGAHDLKTYRAAYAQQPRVTERNPRLYLLIRILGPSVDRAIAQHFASRAYARLAAASLAMLLYRADHDGAFPKNLDELAPKYLPSVPVDPLAAAGSPIGWVRDDVRPRLYSVGEDGVDNGGTAWDPDDVQRGKTRSADLVADLLPQARPLPETRQSEEP